MTFLKTIKIIGIALLISFLAFTIGAVLIDVLTNGAKL